MFGVKIDNEESSILVNDMKKWVLHRRVTLHEKRIFVLRKYVKSAEKITFSFAFVCFTEISYFLSFPSNENVRKQHLSANAYFCVNMTFSYMIAGRKD